MKVVGRIYLNLVWTTDGVGLGYPAESILVHGSYLINLGCVIGSINLSPLITSNPDTAKWQTSYECFVDDLKRCHQLGVKLYNWQ